MRGLLGRGRLEPGHGLLLRPAWSIHTGFMRFPIDVVFVDHDQIVIRIEHAMRPFKTASCRGAREVVELAAGECERRGLEVGDRVAWASRSAVGEHTGVVGQLAPSRFEGERPRGEQRPALRQGGTVPAGRPRARRGGRRSARRDRRRARRTATSTPFSSIRTMASGMRSGCRTRFAPTDRRCPSSSSAQTRLSELPQVSRSTTNGIRWTRQSTLSPPVLPQAGEVIAKSGR